MSEFYDRYYPTICIRRAEMKAMENLPDSEKAKMLPVVVLAPWLNSIQFENTFSVIDKSMGDIMMIIDLDRDFLSESDLPSRRYFKELLSGGDSHLKWMALVESRENFIPTIQLVGNNNEQIYYQIEFAKYLGRGMVFRIELNRSGLFEKAIEFISLNLAEDLLVILDYGYKSQTEFLELQLSQYIDRMIELSPEIKFIISGASFPNNFSDYDDFQLPKAIDERLIFLNLKNKYGNYQFFYGDWASTKPRDYTGGGSKPLPRIDFPTSRSWIIARSKENDWGFREAAVAITRLPEWAERPMVWGTGLIERTARSIPGGITTGPQSIAARVNIHLYIQNNFGQDLHGAGPEGEWVDPI